MFECYNWSHNRKLFACVFSSVADVYLLVLVIFVFFQNSACVFANLGPDLSSFLQSDPLSIMISLNYNNSPHFLNP